ANLLSASGYEVEREYYINDAGKQVELLGLSVYARYQQKLGNEIPFPENGYRGGYIDELADEIINEKGNRYLDVPHDECLDFVKDFSYKRMLKNIELDLRDFGIAFDRWQSERELYDKGRVDDALAALKHRGYLYERDGALWFRSTAFGDDKDRVVLKKGGEYTYFASDIAYHKNKLNMGFDSLIDIWGADHHGYVSRIESAIKAFGHPKKKLRVLLVQMVTLLRHGKPVQMSKRAGEFITLREVISEVGADTAKFIFLTRRSDSHLDFDLDIAKEQSAENPVYYVQYAFARIASIFRQAIEKNVQGFNGSNVQGIDFSLLTEPEEISTIKKLAQYPIVFEGAVMALEPHRITYYLQGLAGLFHSYYNKYRVVSENKELTLARLGLCRAVQMVLGEGLEILGVHAPERM
ncbi:MAG: arginine--tRNA ligase, partial [Nitrospirae bacterium]|nr:arginine--tRNA ligase [Nitrospirota bacterium]